jgi:hypothetical protein
MSDEGRTRNAQRWWQAHVECVRRDSAFHAFVGLYAVAGLVTGVVAGVPAKFAPLTYVYYSIPLAVLAIVIGGGIWALCTGQPFAAVRRAGRMLARPEGAAAALLYVSLSIHMGVFTSIKTMLPDIRPFYADRVLADLSEWLHGELMWRYTTALLPPDATGILCQVYFGVWGLLLSCGLLACVLAPQLRELRTQYLWTHLLMWPLLGNVVAGAAMSAGPIYYGLVTGDSSRFAGLVMYLAHYPPLMEGASNLWKAYASGQATVAAGISAFPSMHLANATLFMLMARRIHPALTWAGAAFVLVILFASVHLGWHYAVDGYFAVGATVAIWAVVGRMLRRRPGAANRVPARSRHCLPRRGALLVRLFPVRTDPDLGQQRHTQFRDAGHQLRDLGPDPVDLAVGHFEDEFVVHLHDHLRAALLRVQYVLDLHHRQLDQVGGRALHGRVDRLALGAATPRPVR